MLKAVVLLRRKPGLTFEQFRHHYETNHVPLLRKALPAIGKYVRNYLDLNSVSGGRQEEGAEAVPTPYFDVITEVRVEECE